MPRCVHRWVPMRGTTRERCELCRTVYPCVLNCVHLDCRADKGQPMPDWVRLVTSENVEDEMLESGT